ncbi:DUF2683 family protein [Kaistella antarctica]|uniref:Uncharacterized protein n=1 Tax=Kaistella antarctica TaxID=266748 RepID=A0A448NR60_9FLAO|nr:DUF2683 family protein [Kaistella antarctica]KEY18864.1 hypothetical protein HY04_10370 [Kaistella antarctica]SEW14550.1 hypothetical protein SAMN05421765_2659 [Kaistella antarctica]VEH99340.1 Uncharacterised protein [Kaistella antarctica]
MENLIVYPENQKQLSILKSLLEEMKIRFKSEQKEMVRINISNQAKNSILKGLVDAEKGNLVSEKEANQFFEDVINQMD